MTNTPTPKGSPGGTLFAEFAGRLLEQGYAPIPVHPGDKRPAITAWQRYGAALPSSRQVERWSEQFPGHNVGAAGGRLVALDIDDDTTEGASELQQRAFSQLGQTPLIRIGRAPRRVLLYRADVPFPTMKRPIAQVIAQGLQVVLFGQHPSGTLYTWVDETPVEVPLSALPTINETQARAWLGADNRVSEKGAGSGTLSRSRAISAASGAITEGARNEYVFREALGLATVAGSLDDLANRLLGINAAICFPPLSAREVAATARSVWGYKLADRLFVLHGVANAVISASEFARLVDEPDAIVLLIRLRLDHGAREEPFALATRAMTEARVVGGWSRKLYLHARDILLERGFLELVQEGGKGRGDPNLYNLRKGSPTGTQYKTTFSLSNLGVVAVEQRASFHQVRYDADGSRTVTSAELVTSLLFSPAALPIAPGPVEQLRGDLRQLLAAAPRGSHTRIAGALGVSRQALSNWKAGRYPLNAGAEARLRQIVRDQQQGET